MVVIIFCRKKLFYREIGVRMREKEDEREREVTDGRETERWMDRQTDKHTCQKGARMISILYLIIVYNPHPFQCHQTTETIKNHNGPKTGNGK